NEVADELAKEFYFYFVQAERAYVFDEERIVARQIVKNAATELYEQTKGEGFTLQTARDVLRLSRKNLVPFLELLDRLQYTKRVGNERIWLDQIAKGP